MRMQKESKQVSLNPEAHSKWVSGRADPRLFIDGFYPLGAALGSQSTVCGSE